MGTYRDIDHVFDSSQATINVCRLTLILISAKLQIMLIVSTVCKLLCVYRRLQLRLERL